MQQRPKAIVLNSLKTDTAKKPNVFRAGVEAVEAVKIFDYEENLLNSLENHTHEDGHDRDHGSAKEDDGRNHSDVGTEEGDHSHDEDDDDSHEEPDHCRNGDPGDEIDHGGSRGSDHHHDLGHEDEEGDHDR